MFTPGYPVLRRQFLGEEIDKLKLSLPFLMETIKVGRDAFSREI